MTIGDADTCQDCGGAIDPLRRVYRASNGGPRCPDCDFRAGLDDEFAELERISHVLAVIGKRVRVLGVVALGELEAVIKGTVH